MQKKKSLESLTKLLKLKFNQFFTITKSSQVQLFILTNSCHAGGQCIPGVIDYYYFFNNLYFKEITF